MFQDIRNNLQAALEKGASLDDAIDSVVSFVLSDPDVIDDLVREAVTVASRYISRASMADQRNRIFSTAHMLAQAKRKGLENLEERVAGLMSFRLPGGKEISKATGHECLMSAAFYRALAATQNQRANWLEIVGRKVGPKVVSEAISENDLQAMFEKATEGIHGTGSAKHSRSA